jgi:hypothetical protein
VTTKKSAPADKNALNYRVIERDLDSLLLATGNKIEREWPRRFASISGARELFLVTLRVADVTFRTIRYICADTPRDPTRQLLYSISVPPLNRTILDGIFNTVFIMEDMPSRCSWYWKASWREHKEEWGRFKSEYGNLPSWSDWLSRVSQYLDWGVRVYGISPEELANPKIILPWPNPGRMPNYGLKKGVAVSPSRNFLAYLNDWFYRDLSGQSHLSQLGLVKRAGFLIDGFSLDDFKEESVTKFKQDQVATAITLVTCFASEIELFFHFGQATKIKYLWTILQEYFPIAKEICDKRYSNLF